MLRYNFTCPNFICPLTKNTHTSPINNFGPSQIFLILFPNLGPHKYFSVIKIGLQNYIISIKAQTHLSCGQNPKTQQNSLRSPLLHSTLLQRSLLHGTLYKVRCYTALYYKACCYIALYYKACCYTTLFMKPVTT